MERAALLDSEQHWYCPNCIQTAVTHEVLPEAGTGSTRMHQCAGLKGLLAPMIQAGIRCKVEAHVREDYEGSDAPGLTRDGEGRPMMNVETTRDDGNDIVVFAPTVIGRVEV